MAFFGSFKGKKGRAAPRARLRGYRGYPGGSAKAPPGFAISLSSVDEANQQQMLTPDQMDDFLHKGEVLEVNSRWLASFQYESANQQLLVTLLAGHRWRVHDIDLSLATEAAQCVSKGRFLWNHVLIRGKGYRGWTQRLVTAA